VTIQTVLELSSAPSTTPFSRTDRANNHGHTYTLFRRPSQTNSLFARLISHQPAVLFSQNEPATSNQPQPASSTVLSEQTSTSHQPSANRTGSKPGRVSPWPFRASLHNHMHHHPSHVSAAQRPPSTEAVVTALGASVWAHIRLWWSGHGTAATIHADRAPNSALTGACSKQPTPAIPIRRSPRSSSSLRWLPDCFRLEEAVRSVT
jgi:hypothetical protein